MSSTHTVNKWPSADGLRVGFLNINHILNKMSDVSDILFNNGKNFHLFGFAETRLSNQISDCELNIPGYHFIRKDPGKSKETGLIVYIHESLHFKELSSLTTHGIESIWIELHFKQSKPLFVSFIYRNPSERNDWIDRFTLMMEESSSFSYETLLLGDFNIDLLKPHKTWVETYESFNLSQVIDKPTRVSATTQTLIDHIYSSSTNTIIETCSPKYGTSDHFPVCLTWSKRGVKIPKNSHKLVTCRSFARFASDAFLSDLENSQSLRSVYQYTDPDEAFEIWYHSFLNIYDKHAPFKTIRVGYNCKKPWMSKDIADAINKRESFLASGDKDKFKKQRNLVNSMKRSAKRAYFKNMIASKSNSKSIWKAINQLTNKNAKSKNPFVKLSSEEMNEHFCNIATTIITSNRTSENNLDILQSYCNFKKIKECADIPLLSVHEVCNALMNLKQTNTRGIDGIDAKILKLSAHVIAETLTYVYNLCISKNRIPKAFKVAKIIPIHKTGDCEDPTNYRPISILSTLSKPLEIHINKHILKHFNSLDLFHQNQSGFRVNHSCHTALTNLIDQWLVNINNDKITGVIAVDFMKAFDVVDRNLLLKKLQMYGITNNTLEFLSSFLSDRKQKVFLNGSESCITPVDYGVPQGSVLGPILFSIYINDLPLYLTAPTEMFADDTTVHTSDSKVDKVFACLQDNMDRLVRWSEINHMKLHPKKSKYLIIITRQKRQNLCLRSHSLFINGELMEEVDHHKILGVIVDNNLSWSYQLSMLCKQLSRKVYQLSRIKHFLDIDSRKLFFNAYIQSHINYASTLWDSASGKNLKPLFSLYRRSLKLILLKSSSVCHMDYQHLGILPLQLKLEYNKAIFMFKIMSNLAPPSLKQKFDLKLIRNIFKINVPLPRVDIFKSSLLYSGGCLWNTILTSFNVYSSLCVFKKKYHNFLMMKHINSNPC